MLPKRYHAIAFISILVMLLLLGLHLLGIGFGGGQAAARTAAAALARNSSSGSLLAASQQQPFASSASAASSSATQVYRHPIVYDKLTGATNNQINDVLGATEKPQLGDYPLDHYQQQLLQQQQLQQRQQQQQQNPFDQFGDPFQGPQTRNSLHRPPMFGQMLPPPPHLQASIQDHHRPHQFRAPLPPHLAPLQPPQPGQQTTRAPPQNQLIADSLPSASSLNNNGAQRPAANGTNAQLVSNHQQNYYTPPIFAYNQQPPVVYANGGSAAANQPHVVQLAPPVGVPEVPMSVDEYNARQARLRAQEHQPSTSSSAQSNQNTNLLADPQAQQRHRQQMLDRQLLFANPPPPLPLPQPNRTGYYADPSLQRFGGSQQLRPAPYAHQLNAPPPPPLPSVDQSNQIEAPPPNQYFITQPQRPSDRTQPSSGGNSARDGQPVGNSQQVVAAPAHHHTARPPPSPNAQHVESGGGGGSGTTSLPVCAREQVQRLATTDGATNGSLSSPAMLCNEDSEYPVREIMRSLEVYASDRSIEQILPQQLVQMLVQTNRNSPVSELQRQLAMDPLQASLNLQQSSPGASGGADSLQQQPQSPSSGDYESMCRSTVYMAQPRRAKNLLGQWKIVINLPGHKYRGIAISQMVRVEECSRPNSECASSPSSSSTSKLQLPAASLLARSRCLQHYENQRLVAWSHQQGIHLDIFRIPSACSCHIRR